MHARAFETNKREENHVGGFSPVALSRWLNDAVRRSGVDSQPVVALLGSIAGRRGSRSSDGRGQRKGESLACRDFGGRQRSPGGRN